MASFSSSGANVEGLESVIEVVGDGNSSGCEDRARFNARAAMQSIGLG